MAGRIHAVVIDDLKEQLAAGRDLPAEIGSSMRLCISAGYTSLLCPGRGGGTGRITFAANQLSG